MTVDGLMSTQTTLTHAGNRLPTAIEWSVVAIIRQKSTPPPAFLFPRISSRIRCCDSSVSGDDVRERAVVANAPAQDIVDAVLDALIHDAGADDLQVDRAGRCSRRGGRC